MKTQWEYVVLKLTVDVSFFSRTDFDPAKLHDELNARGAEVPRAGNLFPCSISKDSKAAQSS